jgi:hypothetical protein
MFQYSPSYQSLHTWRDSLYYKEGSFHQQCHRTLVLRTLLRSPLILAKTGIEKGDLKKEKKIMKIKSRSEMEDMV